MERAACSKEWCNALCYSAYGGVAVTVGMVVVGVAVGVWVEVGMGVLVGVKVGVGVGVLVALGSHENWFGLLVYACSFTVLRLAGLMTNR